MEKIVISGKVENHLVDTHGGDFTYELQVGYESVEWLFRKLVGENVRVTIEVLEGEQISDESDYE